MQIFEEKNKRREAAEARSNKRLKKLAAKFKKENEEAARRDEAFEKELKAKDAKLRRALNLPA